MNTNASQVSKFQIQEDLFNRVGRKDQTMPRMISNDPPISEGLIRVPYRWYSTTIVRTGESMPSSIALLIVMYLRE